MKSQGGSDLTDAVAGGMPRQRRNFEAKVQAHRVGDRRAVLTEGRQVSDGTAELESETPSDADQPIQASTERIEPTDHRETERRRRGGLHEGSGKTRCVAVLGGQRSQAGAEASEIVIEDGEPFANLKHEPGVDDILSGGPEVDVLSLLLSHPSLQCGDQRDDRRADLPTLGQDLFCIEGVGGTPSGNGLGCRVRNQANAGGRPRQGRFDSSMH